MPVSTRNKVEVKIGGKEYMLVGSESDEYIQRVALYIDKKLNEILKANRNLSTSMASVLAAINVADDYFKIKEENVGMKAQLEKTLIDNKNLNEEVKYIIEENKDLANKNSSMQLELVKVETELKEARNSLIKYSRVEA